MGGEKKNVPDGEGQRSPITTRSGYIFLLGREEAVPLGFTNQQEELYKRWKSL
jgi:hypothetical protein